MSLLLTVNAGSATLKLSGWQIDATPVRRWRVDIDLTHGGAPRIVAQAGAAAPVPAETGSDAATHLRTVIDSLSVRDAIDAVAHRVVHGGDHAEPALRIHDAMRTELGGLARFAPLHQPAALALIDIARARLPQVPHFACLDSAFHARQPEVARRYALPAPLWDAGVKAYGFHGLSYASVLWQLAQRDPALATGNIVVAHLGNGASACAVASGTSVATTMGFSTLDGLVMGTRCGHLDPGVILHLLREGSHDVRSLEELLYRRSGLLGVSGSSGDVRDLLATDTPAAHLALDLFAHRAAREIAALLPSLASFDALVFTGGIGEHADSIRADIVRRLGVFGMTLAPDANRRHAFDVTGEGSRVRVLVLPSDEEAAMARACVDARAT